MGNPTKMRACVERAIVENKRIEGANIRWNLIRSVSGLTLMNLFWTIAQHLATKTTINASKRCRTETTIIEGLGNLTILWY